jgi:DNA-directed RNA polymerase specialized sigma24 family protein
MTQAAFERTLDRVLRQPPSPSERRVLELWVIEGLRQSEIAGRLRLSASTIDSLLASAERRTHDGLATTRVRRGFERALLMTYAVELHREEAACG